MPSQTGAYTAIITPFKNHAVDVAALERVVQAQLDGGINGLVPCGTTGESPTLSVEEYELVVKTAVRVRNQHQRRDVPVFAGAGSNCTHKTVELAKRMQAAGADGLLIVAPYYNRPSQEGLFQHYRAVAATTPLPIMLYNIPGRCGVEVSVDTIRRIREACPTFTSVKHATGNVAGVSEVLAACDVAVLSGDDPITLPMMAVGAVGVVSVLSNLAPRTVTNMTQAALKGEWATARKLHDQLFKLGQTLLTLDTNPVPIKTAMALRGFCTDELRLPMAPLAAEKRTRLEKLLAEMKVE